MLVRATSSGQFSFASRSTVRKGLHRNGIAIPCGDRRSCTRPQRLSIRDRRRRGRQGSTSAAPPPTLCRWPRGRPRNGWETRRGPRPRRRCTPNHRQAACGLPSSHTHIRPPSARINIQRPMVFDCSRPQSQTVNTSKLVKGEGELRASTTTSLVLAPCRHRIDRCTVDNQRPRLEGSLVKEMK
jgi:hypothetical protein